MLVVFTDFLLRPAFSLLSRPLLIPLTTKLFIFFAKALGISNHYMHKSGLTEEEVYFLRNYLKHTPNPTVFDVGFNEGAFSFHVRDINPSAVIYAFEPNPKLAFHKLEPSDKFHFFPCGLSDRSTAEAKLYDVRDSDGTSIGSLHQSQLEIWGHEKVDEHSIKLDTIDEIVKKQKIQEIDYLKIDTEGHDLAVLRGATQTLKEQKIRAIQFEFTMVNAKIGIHLNDFVNLLGDSFDLFRLNYKGRLVPIAPYTPRLHEQYGSQNFVAIRKCQ